MNKERFGSGESKLLCGSGAKECLADGASVHRRRAPERRSGGARKRPLRTHWWGLFIIMKLFVSSGDRRQLAGNSDTAKCLPNRRVLKLHLNKQEKYNRMISACQPTLLPPHSSIQMFYCKCCIWWRLADQIIYIYFPNDHGNACVLFRGITNEYWVL